MVSANTRLHGSYAQNSQNQRLAGWAQNGGVDLRAGGVERTRTLEDHALVSVSHSEPEVQAPGPVRIVRGHDAGRCLALL